MEHHHTFWQWLNHNWAVISLVWFPAFLGYLNAFAASCKVMGWDKFAAWLGKVEDALTTFVATVRSQNQTGGNKNATDTSGSPSNASTDIGK